MNHLGDGHLDGLGNYYHPVALAPVESGGELALVHHRGRHAVGRLVGPVGDDLDQALVAPPLAFVEPRGEQGIVDTGGNKRVAPLTRVGCGGILRGEKSADTKKKKIGINHRGLRCDLGEVSIAVELLLWHPACWHLLRGPSRPPPPELGVHEDVADALRVLLVVPKVAHCIRTIHEIF